MAVWLIMLLGLIICLAFVGGIIMYSLTGALHSEDSTTIDPINTDKEY